MNHLLFLILQNIFTSYLCFFPCWFMCLWLSTSSSDLWLLGYGSSQSEWGYPAIFLPNPALSSRVFCVTGSMQVFPQRKRLGLSSIIMEFYNIFSNLVISKPGVTKQLFWWPTNRDEMLSNVCIAGAVLLKIIITTIKVAECVENGSREEKVS